MDLADLIDSYGYYAVFIGAFFEGETVLALAGVAAYRGYMEFYNVVVVALIAGFLGDQMYFFLGRFKGRDILERFPHAGERAKRFDDMLARWHAPLIVGIRFMYGFRIVGPILLGMGRVPAWKFMVYNFIGAAIWAPLIAGIGYFFGTLIETILSDLKRFELWVFLGIAVIGLVSAIWHHLRQEKLDVEVAPAPPPADLTK
jgi:membrane protein DedA with SNARE-associated domain